MSAVATVFPVDEANFDARVVAASFAAPVLVDIGADWCAPCKVLTPRLQHAVEAHGGAVRLALVDADENMRLAGRHQVRGFPTVIAYRNGREAARFHGAQTPAFLRAFIADLLAASDSPTSGPQPAAAS
jgi:putative thioredoxin